MKEATNIEARSNYMSLWYVSGAVKDTDDETVREVLSQMNSIYDSPGVWRSAQELFQKKYHFVQAIFFIDALNWAANSNNPKKNLSELIKQPLFFLY